MSNSQGNNKSPIRRISKEENERLDKHRAWPDKKHLSSEQNIPLPKPGEKNRIHSVLVALPVLMLIIGLVFYFLGESAQNNGTPVLEEMVSREGVFKSVSEVSGIGSPKYYLWYTTTEYTRGVRIKYNQFVKLSELSKGDELSLDIAPTVPGSATLWAYRVAHGDEIYVEGN